MFTGTDRKVEKKIYEGSKCGALLTVIIEKLEVKENEIINGLMKMV